MTARTPPLVLTIAGSDSGGGAGIQADLKTIHALGGFGTSVITALTAQNTVGVTGIHAVPPAFVRAQLDAVLDDIGTDAAKIGMLGTTEIIEAVAAGIDAHQIPNLVVDPVAASKHGDALLASDAEAALRDIILPRAFVATPNLGEVALLAGIEVASRRDLARAAEAFLALGPTWVVVKGGHLPDNEEAVDLLTNGDVMIEVASRRLDTRDTHGTGCTYSAAIATHLAAQVHAGVVVDVPAAVQHAKDYLTGALTTGIRIGAGIGPVDHDWRQR